MRPAQSSEALGLTNITACLTNSAYSRLLCVVIHLGDKRFLMFQSTQAPSHEGVVEQLQPSKAALTLGRLMSFAGAANGVEQYLAAALHAATKPQHHLMPRGGLAGWQLNKAKKLLSEDFSRHLPVSQVAALCGISEGHFSRNFKLATGQAPNSWRLTHRLHFCRQQLMDSNTPLTKLAAQAGFRDQSYFSRAFLHSVGMSPAEWRRTFRNSSAPGADRRHQSAVDVHLSTTGESQIGHFPLISIGA